MSTAGHKIRPAKAHRSSSGEGGDVVAETVHNDNTSYIVDLLDADALAAIVAHVSPDDVFPFALACKQTETVCRQIRGEGKKYLTNGTSSVSRVEWAMNEMGAKPDPRWSAVAARQNALDVLRTLRKNGCPWDEYTCAYAARSGHLDVLQWAHKNGCWWEERTCAAAARCGHLEVLQWARENGCPWDIVTCAYAARSGHLEVLQWARENGCPWDEDTRVCASICVI